MKLIIPPIKLADDVGSGFGLEREGNKLAIAVYIHDDDGEWIPLTNKQNASLVDSNDEYIGDHYLKSENIETKLHEVINQLKIMNAHLQLITDEQFTCSDIGE